MTDSLRVWWKLPELSERLTMLVIVGTRSAEHSLRRHGICYFKIIVTLTVTS